ncbi:unnamed protein product [Nyctereutes procyonoides]|uniref:Fibroblast growth factor n=1 Tax=Nyctereutes procyonoides TaxID=34880 RepID=A0A811ZJF0_NYCPR|nr:unnamed protein product [Nyctereutes procyonoides]
MQLPGPECSSPSPSAAPRPRVQLLGPRAAPRARVQLPGPSAAPRARVQLPGPECRSPARAQLPALSSPAPRPAHGPRARAARGCGPAGAAARCRAGGWGAGVVAAPRTGSARARGRRRLLARLWGRGHPGRAPPGVGHGSREHHHAVRPAGAFPPGHFKDPKRLYCKNGGFFLRIHPEGRVDGVREKSDPHVKLQLQVEERGVVSVRGVCANRYPATKEGGRLLASQCVTDECFFFERLESKTYNTYRSRKCSS